MVTATHIVPGQFFIKHLFLYRTISELFNLDVLDQTEGSSSTNDLYPFHLPTVCVQSCRKLSNYRKVVL